MNNFSKFYNQSLKKFANYLLVIDPKKRPSLYEMGKYEIFEDEIGII